MSEYVISMNKKGYYFAGLQNIYTNSNKYFANIRCKWTKNINEANIFYNINDLNNIIIENNLEKCIVIEDPHGKRIIKKLDIEHIKHDNLKNTIENCILKAIENIFKKLLNNGINEEAIKNEFINHLKDNKIIIEFPVNEFPCININNKNKIFEILIKNKHIILIDDMDAFKFKTKEIEEKLNSIIEELGFKNKLEYIGYYNKLILKEKIKAKNYYNYSIYLKFQLKND